MESTITAPRRFSLPRLAGALAIGLLIGLVGSYLADLKHPSAAIVGAVIGAVVSEFTARKGWRWPLLLLIALIGVAIILYFKAS
jgi:hypothetical protein